MSTKYFKSLDESVPEGKLAYIKDVKKGEYIKRSLNTGKVYQRSHVAPRSGGGRPHHVLPVYSCDDVEDISREIFLKGSTIVWVGFTY
jgi:hypothetical protein